MGRFFNVDPLSEKYAYQSHYNFSENRLTDGRELEGLEHVDNKDAERWAKNADVQNPYTLEPSEDGNGVNLINHIDDVIFTGGKKASFGEEALELVIDFSPIGDVRDIIEGSQDGDYLKVAIASTSLPMTFIAPGSGSLIKGGLKTAFKKGAKEFAENGAREVAENASEWFVKEMAEEGFTKSSRRWGQEVHKYYKKDLDDGINYIKEFRDIKGIRPDFVDKTTNTIYELKPYNNRARKAGEKQLEKYKEKFEKAFPGTTWNTVLT